MSRSGREPSTRRPPDDRSPRVIERGNLPPLKHIRVPGSMKHTMARPAPPPKPRPHAAGQEAPRYQHPGSRGQAKQRGHLLPPFILAAVDPAEVCRYTLALPVPGDRHLLLAKVDLAAHHATRHWRERVMSGTEGRARGPRMGQAPPHRPAGEGPTLRRNSRSSCERDRKRGGRRHRASRLRATLTTARCAHHSHRAGRGKHVRVPGHGPAHRGNLHGHETRTRLPAVPCRMAQPTT